LQEWVESATFNGLGHLVTGSNDGSINVFDVASGNCISKTWYNGNQGNGGSHRLGNVSRARALDLAFAGHFI
jgi:WD40 repeat protein